MAISTRSQTLLRSLLPSRECLSTPSEEKPPLVDEKSANAGGPSNPGRYKATPFSHCLILETPASPTSSIVDQSQYFGRAGAGDYSWVVANAARGRRSALI
jgi:hypothetical protein